MADYDPRLVDLYDIDNPDGPDHDFYRGLADDVDARSILDLGCGTGILTVTFARPGRSVVGVDPSAAMLAHAASRAGGGNVRWVHGDSRAIPDRVFDYAVMTGNVAQHIADEDWPRTLSDLRAALCDDGLLAFESRDPVACAWAGWTSPIATTRATSHGPLREWSAAREIAPGRVLVEFHNRFEDTGDDVVDESVLVFRDRDGIERDLLIAGFRVDSVHGSWDRSPVTGDTKLLIFTARAA